MVQKVTILLPVYKPNLFFLEEQLISVSNQTFSDYLCIVSQDDLGDQGVSDLLNRFDERFVLNSNPVNLGLYKHMEKLVQENLSKSEYLVTCDQDDVWDLDRLDKQVSFLEKNNFSMATSNALLLINNKKTKIELFKSLGVSNRFVKFALLVNHATGAGSIYRSKDYLNSIPFPINHGVAVHDHWMYIWGVSKDGCAFLNEPSWLYRQHSENQIGVIGVVGFFGKFKLALKKISLALKCKLLGRDPFIDQLLANLAILRERIVNLSTQDNLKIHYTFRELFSPRTLIGSRLESLRMALNYRKLKKFKLFEL